MKKLVFALVCLFAFGAQSFASNDKPVEAEQLPAKIQQFIQTHFNGVEISYAKQDNDLFDRSYTVVFTNGDKVDFHSNGEWEEVDCKHNQVPASLVPEAIGKFIREKHKGQSIVELKKEKKRYEVKLQNGLELEFNQQGKLLHYD